MGTTKTAKKTAPPKPKKAPAASKANKNQAPLDSKGAYDHFSSRAVAIAAKDVPVARGSAAIARTNVDKAVKAISAHFADLRRIAPTLDITRISELPALVRAFDYAEKLVPRDTSDGSIDAALAAVGPVRQAALSFFEAAAFCGLVDAGRVRKLREGRGKLDVASDAVGIAGLFDEAGGALAGKHPFTDEHLTTLRERGGWLVDRLKPSGAVRDPKDRSPAALVKDRFAKLVEDDFAELLKAAVAVWGVDGYRAHVPALYSRARAAPARAQKNKASDEGGGSARQPPNG
jgi:hypothetical protein